MAYPLCNSWYRGRLFGASSSRSELPASRSYYILVLVFWNIITRLCSILSIAVVYFKSTFLTYHVAFTADLSQCFGVSSGSFCQGTDVPLS